MTPAEAEAALEKALEMVAEAHGFEGIRTAFFIGLHYTFFEGEDQRSMVAWHAPAGQSWITTLGLSRAIMLRLDSEYLTPDED